MPRSLHHRSPRFFGPPKVLPGRRSPLTPRMFLLRFEQLCPTHFSRLWSLSNRTGGQLFPEQFLALINQLYRSATKLAHHHFPIHQTQAFVLRSDLKPAALPSYRPVFGPPSRFLPTQALPQIPRASSMHVHRTASRNGELLIQSG